MSKINETNYPRRTQANYEDTDMIVIQEAGGNTHTTRIEDLREDCQETLAPALDTMRENLATIEGSTASKAYAKGDYLVFDGRLCKAKTSIAVNATLILDTNIELASVGGELSSLSSDLTANALDNPIDISGYTSSNKYQIPKDGYIRYRVRQGETGGCSIYGSNQSNNGYIWDYITTAAHDTRGTIFVKKGMYAENDGAYALDFVGLS